MIEALSDMTPWLVVMVCIISEAFFAASELSILSADRISLEAQAEQGDQAAERVLWFKSRPDQLFGTTLLGTNISTVTGSTIASLTLLSKYPTHGEWWAMLFMSPLVLMGGEILPKSLAQSQAHRFAKLLSGPLKLFNYLFSPVISLVSRYTTFLSKKLNLPEGKGGITREELIFLVREEESVIEEEEREMISRIFAFKQLIVRDVMIPLAELEALPREATVQEGASFIIERGFSRVPIFEERVDQIIGVVHHLDLLNASDATLPLGELIRPVIYAPEVQEVDELLSEIQRVSASLVIVVDEFGSAVGLLTLEDLIEEIVGEIDDEFDKQEVLWRRGPNYVYFIEGRALINDLNYHFYFKIPDSDEYDTIAGYLITTLRRIPNEGDSVMTPSGIKLYVTKASDRAVEEISFQGAHRQSIKLKRMRREEDDQ